MENDPFAQLESMISSIESQDAAPVDAPPPASVAKESIPVEAAPEAPPAPAEAPPAEPPKAPEPDRASERLAARMKLIEEREKALEEKERSYRTVVSQLRRGNVVDAFKAIGVPEAEIPSVVRVAMASQLPPDKVPDQYKSLREKLELEDRFHQQQAELERLRGEMATRERQAQEAQAVAAYEAEVAKFLEAPADTPTLARLPKDKARARILAAVQKDASDKWARIQRGELDPNEVRPLSPADAAKLVEAELAEYASIFAPSQESTTAPKTAPRVTLANRAGTPQGRQQTPDLDPDPVSRVDDWLRQSGLK